MPMATATEAIQPRKPVRTRRKPLIQPAMPTRPKAASAQIEFRQASSATFMKLGLTHQHNSTSCACSATPPITKSKGVHPCPNTIISSSVPASRVPSLPMPLSAPASRSWSSTAATTSPATSTPRTSRASRSTATARTSSTPP